MNDGNQRIKKEFRNYLMKKYRLRKSTADTYISSINRLSRLLNFNGTIYDVRKLSDLESIKKDLFVNNKFNALDRSDRNRFTTSFNRYYEFISLLSFRSRRTVSESSRDINNTSENKDVAKCEDKDVVTFTYKVSEFKNPYGYVNNRPVTIGSLSGIYTCFTCPYISID